MNLYQSVQQSVNIANLVNDTTLHIFGHLTWAQLVSNNRLSGEAEAELAATIAYWQGIYDGKSTEDDEYTVRLRQQAAYQNAYLGAERRQITESQFYDIIGYEAGVIS